MSAETFCDRMLAETGGLHPTTAIHRRTAARVLKGIDWRFVPTVKIERRPYIEIGTLAMLCCCLDDHEIGATPGSVTAAQLWLAWSAAGFRDWLLWRTKQRMVEQAASAVLAQFEARP